MLFNFLNFFFRDRIWLAIAMLWIEFVREVRWCWEESQPLPKIQVNDTIDLSSCLIHQKLQMVSFIALYIVEFVSILFASLLVDFDKHIIHCL